MTSRSGLPCTLLCVCAWFARYLCHCIKSLSLRHGIVIMIAVTRSLQKMKKMCPKMSQIGSVGHLGPHCGAMGDPGEPRGSFFDDSDRCRVSAVDPPDHDVAPYNHCSEFLLAPCFSNRRRRRRDTGGAGGASRRAGPRRLR